jgi:D-alanyl-D-alanine carboxypeptidase
MSPAARFPIYSITRTFTAVCALRMAEAGALELDVPIERWLPELPFAGDVTLRCLLGHTAGVFNYSALPAYHAAVREHPREPWSFEEFVARTCHRPLDFAPGNGWAYSNTGYTLVRRVLELETGLRFGAVVAREIASELGLTSTAALEQLDDMRAVVPGYSAFFSDLGAHGDSGALGDVRPIYHPGWCGTGVLASTGPETCRFFEAVFDGTLLSAPRLAEMLDVVRVPGEHPPAVDPSYGLGVMAVPSSPIGPEYGHGGGGPGFDLHAGHWPATPDGAPRLTVTVFCNGDGDHALPIAASVARALRA